MLLSITFFLALGATLVAVFMTVQTGRRGDRMAHLVRALSTVGLLGVTILLALWLGEQLDFPTDAMDIHKIFARTAGLLVLPVVGTGIVLWHRPAWRIAHRACVYLLLVVLLIAVGTGIWVFSLSTPKT
ncbi:MAG: hypothetical protein V3U11_14260 [Planctomycetota bacterium]